MRWLGSITDSMDMNSSTLQEKVEDRGSVCYSRWGSDMGLSPRARHDLATEQQ